MRVETIRYYERRGLYSPSRRAAPAGYRLYDDADLWRLETMARAKRLGFTLAEITELFGPGHHRSPDEVLDTAHAKLAAVNEQLRTLAGQRCQLRRLVEVCRHGDGEACLALRLDELGGTVVSAEIALSDATFDELVRSSERPVLVNFWGAWCQPCKMLRSRSSPRWPAMSASHSRPSTSMRTSAHPPLRRDERTDARAALPRWRGGVARVGARGPRTRLTRDLAPHL